MHRKAISLLALLLVLSLLTGCTIQIIPNDHTVAEAATLPATEPPAPTVTEPPTEAVTVPEATAPDTFTAYEITVRSPKLAIHSGPDYNYDIVDYITDQGDYTIIAHESESLGDDRQTTWGRLQSEKGWINLDDAFADGFEPYLFKIKNPWLEIYSGPGYAYTLVSAITDQGTYTIVEESNQFFSSGRYVTWGKLKSGVGWICLDDAKLNPGLPPYRCTECGRADVSISRYGLCQACHKQAGDTTYGYCEVCGIALNFTESASYDGTRCYDCCICDNCGTHFDFLGETILDDDLSTIYVCPYCYEQLYRCSTCGTTCYPDKAVDGMCDSCYEKEHSATYGYCNICGNDLSYDEYKENDGTVCFDCLVCNVCGDPITIMDVAAFSGYMCWSCYEDMYCCSICGTDCYYPGTIDGMCEDCYNSTQNSTDYCTNCGTELHDGNTAYNGFGKCEDCYYETLDPEYICDNCGADCSFRGVYDGLCEDCYEASQ